MKTQDYMQRAITLAEKGRGLVSPNPLVGAVIVKEGKIIGEGWHRNFGNKHAEIEALENCTDNPEGSDIYVNLEPCSHFGKTPPCTDAIIKSGIKKVFIGNIDPNPLVKGKGVEKLKSAGIEVETGICEDECSELNRFFFKLIKSGLPYVTLKSAQTIDGKIADLNGNSKWISCEESRKLVHQWRSEYDAVMVGKGTVIKDNPALNVRLVKGRNPHKIIVDHKLSLGTGYRLFEDKSSKIFIITSNPIDAEAEKEFKEKGINIIGIPPNKKGYPVFKEALKILAELGIASVLVEGGSAIFSAIMQENLADELVTFVSPKILGPGKSVFDDIAQRKIEDTLNFKLVESRNSGTDILLRYKRI